MENTDTNEKTYEHCNYFSRYYTIFHLQLNAVYCGLCFYGRGKTINIDKSCSHWEPALQEKKRKDSARSFMRYVAKKIEQIALILEYDQKSTD